MWKYTYQVPDMRKIRYIIHADAKNEADDQFTIAHALMMAKFDIAGIIGGHFDDGNHGRFEEHTTAQASTEEINRILGLMKLEGRYPVFCGSNLPLKDEKTPVENDAARFIVEEAMKDDKRPLFIGMQGAITDLASAILMEPEICNRMTAIWIGGGDYPKGSLEFNLRQDINAANVVFSSNMPLWQVPRHTYKQFEVSLAELQLKVEPCGEIGHYLYQQMVDFNNETLRVPTWPQGEVWSLGDEGCVCALMQEDGRDDSFEVREAPYVLQDGSYEFGHGFRNIRVYDRLDSRLDLEDLFARLKINFGQ